MIRSILSLTIVFSFSSLAHSTPAQPNTVVFPECPGEFEVFQEKIVQKKFLLRDLSKLLTTFSGRERTAVRINTKSDGDSYYFSKRNDRAEVPDTDVILQDFEVPELTVYLKWMSASLGVKEPVIRTTLTRLKGASKKKAQIEQVDRALDFFEKTTKKLSTLSSGKTSYLEFWKATIEYGLAISLIDQKTEYTKDKLDNLNLTDLDVLAKSTLQVFYERSAKNPKAIFIPFIQSRGQVLDKSDFLRLESDDGYLVGIVRDPTLGDNIIRDVLRYLRHDILHASAMLEHRAHAIAKYGDFTLSIRKYIVGKIMAWTETGDTSDKVDFYFLQTHEKAHIYLSSPNDAINTILNLLINPQFSLHRKPEVDRNFLKGELYFWLQLIGKLRLEIPQENQTLLQQFSDREHP